MASRNMKNKTRKQKGTEKRSKPWANRRNRKAIKG